MPPVLHLKTEDVDTPEKRGGYTVALIGCGPKAIRYALAFADAGFKVLCADADQSVIKRLSKGNLHLGDRQAESKFKHLIRKEQLNVTSDLKAAVSRCDILIITVGVKIDEKKNGDTSEIAGVCKQVGTTLQKGSLIVYCGVAGIGAVETVVKESIENTSGLMAGEDFGIAYWPTYNSTMYSEQQVGDEELVISSNDKSSLNSATSIFQQIARKDVKRSSNIKVAELAMLFAAVKRDVGEALANEMAMFCERAGLDYIEVAKLLETDIHGANFIPTISDETNSDEAYVLLENAENLNVKFRLPAIARQVNEEMVKHAVSLVQDALHDGGKTLRRARVALLGATKAGTAAATFVELLRTKGAKVTRYDPSFSITDQSEEPSLKKTLNETVEGTDCLVIMSSQEQLKRLNLKKLHALMKSPAAIVDLVGVAEPGKVAGNGFIYRGLGRGAWKK